MAKPGRNNNDSFPHYSWSAECAHKKDYLEKNYFVSIVGLLRNKNVDTNTITESKSLDKQNRNIISMSR